MGAMCSQLLSYIWGQAETTNWSPLPTELFSELPESEQHIFKKFSDHPIPLYCLITENTIFYPQSGGQPSDIGLIKSITGTPGTIFKVLHARIMQSKCVIHLGIFASDSAKLFSVGEAVIQEIDNEARTLNSIYHTAGHILYDAVSSLNQGWHRMLDIQEGVSKAHFFPTGSYVEFNGVIENSDREAIQIKVNELVAKKARILTHWWSLEGKEKEPLGLDRIDVDELRKMQGARVTTIEGGNPWACCGTHVEDTAQVGSIGLSKKFRRSNGKTSIGYKVEGSN